MSKLDQMMREVALIDRALEELNGGKDAPKVEPAEGPVEFDPARSYSMEELYAEALRADTKERADVCFRAILAYRLARWGPNPAAVELIRQELQYMAGRAHDYETGMRVVWLYNQNPEPTVEPPSTAALAGEEGA